MRTAVALAVATLLPISSSAAAEPKNAAQRVLPIDAAVAALQSADESRAGYSRTAFKHWTSGDNPTDGCNTRQEVLIAEAVTAPEVGPRCAITGGTWFSYYDEVTVDGARGLDIDHMVPLAEAWDSGASAWTAARREAYANDQGQPASLVAVTARTN
ncbi:HNH endonuclease, partial [Streptomyces albidoflavus]|uniref:HNH endonuclease n=1 Tax=Streptomyces albidoflavus TaxID=1886 RepID=UPI0033CA2570